MRLKRTAAVWGQDITGTPIGNNFALPPGEAREKQIDGMKTWIDVSADLGSPAIRTFAGSAPAGTDDTQARKWVVECIDVDGAKRLRARSQEEFNAEWFKRDPIIGRLAAWQTLSVGAELLARVSASFTASPCENARPSQGCGTARPFLVAGSRHASRP